MLSGIWQNARSLALTLQLLLGLSAAAETITGYIYCDNYFEFYFNGQLIAKDPIDFTPHQAVKVSFQYDGTSAKTYAIMCMDYASSSGYEYTSTSNPQLGDGALLAEFSDGTKTSTSWKALTVTFGPTDASITAGCSSTNLSPCQVQDTGTPSNWYLGSFDDSSWVKSTEYTAAQAGWGRTPSYSNGKCGTITSPITKQNANPSSLATTADECLNPRTVLCGGDQSCTGTDGRIIWGADLERDNKMPFRYTVAATQASPTCILSDSSVSACQVPANTNQRIRRELRDLSAVEWDKVVAAMWMMKNTNMADGQTQYGSNFKTYDYFVVRHAVTVGDSRGDQTHFSNAFSTWHGAFVLEFEASLLAIDSSIGALPYWDGTHDVLTSTHFGSGPGAGAANVVDDGKFANWPVVSNFSIADWSSLLVAVNGATNGYLGNVGFLRGTQPNNPLQTSKMTRYGSSWTFSQSAQDACAIANSCWSDWYTCIEGGSSSGNFHSGPHQKIGGKSGSNRGDFEDPVTSPNDPIFMFHHANVERNRLKWMQNHASEASVYYGFGRSCYGPRGTSNSCAASGINLGDVAGALFPFTSQQLGLSALTSAGVTHAKNLCHMGPTSAPYKYADAGQSHTGTSTSGANTGAVTSSTTTGSTGGTSTGPAGGSSTASASGSPAASTGVRTSKSKVLPAFVWPILLLSSLGNIKHA